MSRCQRCQAPITWAIRLKTMKNIPLVPLDPKFPDAPRYRITAVQADGVRECERDDEGGHISHFSNCPHAAQFSKGKRR